MREERTGWKQFAGALALAILATSYVANSSSSYAAYVFLALSVILLIGLRDVLTTANNRARVRADSSGVTIARTVRLQVESRKIRRSEIATGFFVPDRRGGRVFLNDSRGTKVLDARVRDHEEGTALLAALGLDATKQRFTRDVASPLGAILGPMRNKVLAFVGFLAVAGAFVVAGRSPVPAIAVAALAMLVMAWPQRVEIATDGVVVSWFGRRRFTRFADVKEIAIARGAVSLVLHSGKAIVVSRDDQMPAIAARLREAFDAYQQRGSDGVVAALVAREEREMPDWLTHLRGLRSQSYREASIDDEALLRVVEDPGAAPDARAGAVVALRPTLSSAGRERIRVASAATAEPRLRVALDALADASEEQVEAELTRLREE